jgi:hypothetical protein
MSRTGATSGTKEVMKDAHKSGLWKKVADGKGTKEEKEKLVSLYESLPKDTPPRGDKKAWKEKTEAMRNAAKESVTDEKAGGAKLLKLVKCQTCHETTFKGK